MTTLNLIGCSAKKFVKGIIAVHTILIVTFLIIQSCKKSDPSKNDNARESYLSALLNKKNDPDLLPQILAASITPVEAIH